MYIIQLVTVKFERSRHVIPFDHSKSRGRDRSDCGAAFFAAAVLVEKLKIKDHLFDLL